MGVVNHGELLVWYGRNSWAASAGFLLVHLASATALSHGVAQVRVRQFPDCELAATEPPDEVLLIGRVEFEHWHLPWGHDDRVWRQRVAERPNEDMARRRLSCVPVDLLVVRQGLATRASQHVHGARDPLDPFDAFVPGISDVGEIPSFPKLRMRFGHSACVLFAQVRELLLKYIDSLVRLEGLFHAIADVMQEFCKRGHLV
mmetsp:Transcript_101231/g.285369  ORF Transcript_101231/g.285369 Transcript_101231/m.285369 type:complete len:202 (+) Transcript_101231:1165-1770(+)